MQNMMRNITALKKSNKTTVRYFPTTNSVRIDANSTQFYPMYVKYLFEYLKIPKNATIHFKDKKINGGIEEWLNQKPSQK